MNILNFYKKEGPKAEDVKPVPTDNLIEIYNLCVQMEKVCTENNGIGLSAVQVGIPWNLFIVRADGYSLFDPVDKYSYFLNCNYLGIGEKTMSVEGCLSLKDDNGDIARFQVDRYTDILLKGTRLVVKKDISLIEIEKEISIVNQGLVFQHEIDHGNGILISDIGKEIFLWH